MLHHRARHTGDRVEPTLLDDTVLSSEAPDMNARLALGRAVLLVDAPPRRSTSSRRHRWPCCRARARRRASTWRASDPTSSVPSTCPRCVMTTLAQDDLPADLRVLRTIAEENMQPLPLRAKKLPTVGSTRRWSVAASCVSATRCASSAAAAGSGSPSSRVPSREPCDAADDEVVSEP